jgi:hypothetical protein
MEVFLRRYKRKAAKIDTRATNTITHVSRGQVPSSSLPRQGLATCAYVLKALVNNNTITPKPIFNFMQKIYIFQRYGFILIIINLNLYVCELSLYAEFFN